MVRWIGGGYSTHDSLEADAAAAVRQRAVLEGVDVGLDGGGRDAGGLGLLDDEGRLVHTLGAREDLLAADEHVVRVALGLRVCKRERQGVAGTAWATGDSRTSSSGQGMV